VAQNARLREGSLFPIGFMIASCCLPIDQALDDVSIALQMSFRLERAEFR
jgi:hypothetical protein